MAIKRFITHMTNAIDNNRWLWFSGFVGVFLIHLGTALLRLSSFFPFPQSVDFSSYYAGAWSIRLRLSPYPWSKELLQFLFETQNLTTIPPTHNSSPLWPWLLQPLTLLPFPHAATLWLSLLLLLVVYCHSIMVQIAGYDKLKILVLTLPLTLTFGPLFLNLTLGQNGVIILFSVLLFGKMLKHRSRNVEWFAIGTWVVAVGAKLYPIAWIGILLFLKRWRTFASALALCMIAFGATALWSPQASSDYWFNFLPDQTQQYATQASIDDQSLSGFLTRIGTSTAHTFPGLRIQNKQAVTWTMPWEFSPQFIQYFSLGLLLILGTWLMVAWTKNNFQDCEGILYSLVLFSLLFFPHMERYNHILALPAMAWLWGRKTFPYRELSVTAYGLFGLSRLTHFWALLPSPVGPFLSGFGLFGVLTLIFAISHALFSATRKQ